jgi:hypothetical protein
MASKHLFVAAEIGLFEHIADAGSTLEDLSAATRVPRRTLRMIADAMVALGLLERRGDLYLNGPATATFLADRASADLRPMMRFLNRLSYRRWWNLESAVRSAQHVREIQHGWNFCVAPRRPHKLSACSGWNTRRLKNQTQTDLFLFDVLLNEMSTGKIP